MCALSGQTIVFLPGLDGTGMSFEPLARLLPAAARLQVVRYPPDRLLSFDETVRCAREQIRADSPPFIIAESFSGPVAAALVGSGQVKAKCLVFAATFVRSPRPLLLKLRSVLPFEVLISLPLPRFLFRCIIAGGAKNAVIFHDLARRVRAIVPPKTLVHRLKVVDETDVRDLLARISVPCLYLKPCHDRTVPARCLKDFVAALPNLQVVRIDGPHFILQAEPGQCLEAMHAFLASIS